MIGCNSSILMLPHTFPNDKGNHIYYMDNQVELHSSDFVAIQDIGILNLEDGSTKKLLSNVNFFFIFLFFLRSSLIVTLMEFFSFCPETCKVVFSVSCT